MTGKMNIATINSDRAYRTWDMNDGSSTYLSIILCELFYHECLSQEELMERSGIPK